MRDFTEQDFDRLRTEPDFARDVLINNSREMLRAAYKLNSIDPENKNKIISLICCAVRTHFGSIDKIKVIHALSKEMQNLNEMRLRNLYSKQSSKILEFKTTLDNALSYIESKEEGKLQERVEILDKIHPEKENRHYDRFRGFRTAYTDAQLENQLNTLKGQFLDKDTKLINYQAVFRNEYLPTGFSPLRWILLTKFDQPHKLALREFLSFALAKSPDQKTINICFTDMDGNKIRLANPKAREYSPHCIFFENLFKQ